MTITQNPCKHKKLSIRHASNSAFIFGEEPEAWCFQRILHRGKADILAIVILTELLFLRRSFGDEKADFDWPNCFFHFREKFVLKRLAIMRGTARLEAAGLVTRSFHQIVSAKGIASKELDLRLNSAAVDRLITEGGQEYA